MLIPDRIHEDGVDNCILRILLRIQFDLLLVPKPRQAIVHIHDCIGQEQAGKRRMGGIGHPVAEPQLKLMVELTSKKRAASKKRASKDVPFGS
jgi:hypothetical protein